MKEEIEAARVALENHRADRRDKLITHIQAEINKIRAVNKTPVQIDLNTHDFGILIFAMESGLAPQMEWIGLWSRKKNGYGYYFDGVSIQRSEYEKSVSGL